MTQSRSVITVLIVGLLLSIGVGSWIYQLESERIETQFIASAKEKVAAVNRYLIEGFAVLDYVRFVVEESDNADQASLRRIFERIHTQNSLLEGIAWARLENRDQQLSLPIMMVEPRDRYADWLGSDLAKVPDFLETARPVLTGEQLTQVVSVEDNSGRENQLTLTRTHSVKDGSFGLIIASLSIQDLLAEAIGRIPLSGASIEVTLESVNLGQRSFRWPTGNATVEHPRLAYKALLENPANIQLTARVTPQQQFFDERNTNTGWLAAICGIALTLLIALHLSNQVRLRRELEKLSITDALTDIANRRHFDQTLASEWQAARRSQEPISLLMMDIDYFKYYNDHYGHDAGDSCLESVANILSQQISRPRDLLARVGGEEFAVILPNTDQGALALAERCRNAISQANIPHQAAEGRDHLTLSIGCATVRAKAHQPPDHLTKLADDALYQAKANGRDRVETATYSGKTAP